MISTENMEVLADLAEAMLRRREKPRSVLIVPFIGAGCSASAQLPASNQLLHRIYEDLVKEGTTTSRLLERVFDDEARFVFPQKAKHGITRDLKLFEFAAVISRFAYGREKIRHVMSSVMTQASHRPLAYELLAHLAKHEFLDHFVSLNFDLLLDETLDDEIPDRLRLITSPDEVPGPKFAQEAEPNCCYLFKPFGSLSNDFYKLAPDDLRRYGSESIWHFMLDCVLHPQTGNTLPDIVLVLVGYAAAELAFEQLITELADNPERRITIFVIDPRPSIPSVLERFKQEANIDVKHAIIEADLAFDLLVQILRLKYLSISSDRVWVPTARHRIMSILSYRDVTLPPRRFNIELILQAIKSRGFFTIEAVAEIRRIRKYAQQAPKVIERMCGEGVLAVHQSGVPGAPTWRKYLRQDYRLKEWSPEFLAAKLLETSGTKPGDYIEEWNVREQDGGYVAESGRITRREFLEHRFQEIASAPEIEISADTSPSTGWLFKDAQPLTAISQLSEKTTSVFNQVFRTNDPVKVYGVWTTGEWLFHDRGWAWQAIGANLLKLMEEGRLSMSLVLARSPQGSNLRSERASEVLERLKRFREAGCCEINEIDWWRQNRKLTLLVWGNGSDRGWQRASGIYMRRRLATPLVAPVYVHGDDCRVLQEVFDHYKAKALTPERLGTGS